MRNPCGRFLTATSILAIFLLSSCRDSTQKTAVGTFNMGERAQVGSLIYTVFDTQWAISLGEQPNQRIPKNRFFIVNFSVVNSGNQSASVPTLSLVDDAGVIYQEVENGEGAPNWLGPIRTVRPADSVQGTVVFDVPTERFKLRISDEEDRFAYVAIPLSLGEQSPDLMPKGASR